MGFNSVIIKQWIWY